MSSRRLFAFGAVCRLLIAASLVAGGFYVIKEAKKEISARVAFKRRVARVKVVPPHEAPEINQASIDAALVMFGIEVPASAEYPLFDAELRDRGLTSRGAFMDKANVTIGPAAYASWGLLGSTLAHELEVHCRQNFLFIYMMDVIGLDGTDEAERQAYIYELRNARRFHLEVMDAELIAETMDYYYPKSVEGRSPKSSVKNWLARNFLRGRAL